MAGEQKGLDYLVYIDTNPSGTTWTLIGGQKSATFNRQADSIDASHKTTGKYRSKLAGFRNATLSFNNIDILNDAGQAELERAWNADEQVHIAYQTPLGHYYEMTMSITDYSEQSPDDGPASHNVQLESTGAPTKVNGQVAGYPPA